MKAEVIDVDALVLDLEITGESSQIEYLRSKCVEPDSFSSLAEVGRVLQQAITVRERRWEQLESRPII